MATIISTVRHLIQDDTEPFSLTDEEIQTTLDLYSQQIVCQTLYPMTRDGLWWAAFATSWESRTDTDEDEQFIETPISIQDSNGVDVVIKKAFLDRGVWQTEQACVAPLFLRDGYTYDIYAAAASCCWLLIAKIKDEYTFSSSEGSFSRTDRVTTLEKLSEKYNGMARPYVLGASDDTPPHR
jgi:hypothetical protein